ncbi:MAG: alanine racemase [Salinivirgaceae bacterium]
MHSSSIITLNQAAVNNNLKFLKQKLGSRVIISAVVKANAYGHGIEQMVPLLEQTGVNHFSVFDYTEASRVAKSLKNPCPIMIMGWVSDSDLNDAISRGFEFFVFNLERLNKTLELAKTLKLKAKIHIEAETGMNRSGLNLPDLKEALHFLHDNKEHFELKGFCTHLAGAESITNYYRIQQQIKRFHRMEAIVEAAGFKPELIHMANSAAAFVYPKTRMDLVRVGIMLYGFWSSTETFIHYVNSKVNKNDPLQRVLDWKSQVMAIKEIKTGEFVSYGTSYLAQADIKTALIPVGYSCGYSRSLSNRGRVLIRGHRCSVIGVVNMNMIIADVTNLFDVEVGDEVVIIGKQGDLEIKVSAFGDSSNQLNYEVLAHMPDKINRKVITG